jgi:hypothetical protein
MSAQLCRTLVPHGSPQRFTMWPCLHLQPPMHAPGMPAPPRHVVDGPQGLLPQGRSRGSVARSVPSLCWNSTPSFPTQCHVPTKLARGLSSPMLHTLFSARFFCFFLSFKSVATLLASLFNARCLARSSLSASFSRSGLPPRGSALRLSVGAVLLLRLGSGASFCLLPMDAISGGDNGLC